MPRGACKRRVAVAIREPLLEAAMDGASQEERIATNGAEIVVLGDEGEVLTNEEEGDGFAECAMLPEDYACAKCSKVNPT